MFAPKRVALFVLTLILIASLPGTALAHRQYQGDDYSQPIKNRHQMAVCDYERDLNQAYTKFHTYDGFFRGARDRNGSGGRCGYSNYYPNDRVFDHKTCEARTFRPDQCTGYAA